MAVPLTNGIQRINVLDMDVGDYISSAYKATSSTTVGSIFDLGTSTLTELPYIPVGNPNGKFYFNKVATGLLVADRNIHLCSNTMLDNNNLSFNGTPATDIAITMTSPTTITNGTEYSKVINGNNVVVSASSFYTTNYEVYRCLGTTGGADGDRWLSSSSLTGQWLKIDMGIQTEISAYSFQTATMVTASPKEWRMYGSNDGQGWTELDYQNSAPSDSNVHFYSFGSGKKYRFYKWEFINNNGYSGSYRYELADVKLYYNPFKVSGILRLLDGGNIYASQSKNKIIVDTSNSAYPQHNEWDKYIVNGTSNNKIIAGSDSVWHWSGKESWTMSYWNDMASATALTYARVIRGGTTSDKINYADGSSASTYYGYRPVFEYQEV